MRLAAIDVGTNTVRLLVADSGSDLVAKDREITRLGQGVDAQRKLDPAAAERTLASVERFAGRARREGAEHLRVAGTSVLRDAADRMDFAREVLARTEVELEILDGAEEGRIAFLGATWGLSPGLFVVCDIGGGSTELARGSDQKVQSVSLDIGSVRVTERCLLSDPPSKAEVSHAVELVDGELFGAAPVGIQGSEQLVGVAGTVTTLAAVVMDVRPYDPEAIHHSTIGIGEVVEWSERLLSMSASEIRDLGTVEPGRSDVIAGGVLILRRIMETWGFEAFLTSERDILDGLVLDLASRLKR